MLWKTKIWIINKKFIDKIKKINDDMTMYEFGNEINVKTNLAVLRSFSCFEFLSYRFLR